MSHPDCCRGQDVPPVSPQTQCVMGMGSHDSWRPHKWTWRDASVLREARRCWAIPLHNYKHLYHAIEPLALKDAIAGRKA